MASQASGGAAVTQQQNLRMNHRIHSIGELQLRKHWPLYDEPHLSLLMLHLFCIATFVQDDIPTPTLGPPLLPNTHSSSLGPQQEGHTLY